MPSITQNNEQNPSAKDSETSLAEAVEIDSASEDEGEPSLMEVEGAKRLAKLRRKQDAEFENKLQYLKNNPERWQEPENKYLREFSNYVECNHERFPCLPGDNFYDQVVAVRKEQKQLTKGYIKAIAEFKDTSFVREPVLYVLARTTSHDDQSFSGFSDKPSPPVKTTRLRLMDGDGNTMSGRLSTEMADKGKELKKGSIIRLDRFTELTHHLNANTPKLPMLFILKYSPIGYSGTPPVQEASKPLPCSNVIPTEAWPPKIAAPSDMSVDRSDAPVDCCAPNRYCSMHGVSFVVCVCESIPVEKLDLAAVKEDCYFATDELDKMSNSHKRNMIYWWYATNVYSICGKAKRKQLPKCLVHKIRQCHPSDEYSGYEHSCGMHNNH